MKSIELADEVEKTIREARSRIVGVGREQYEEEDAVQRFETRTLDDLIQNVREELIDTINWAVMLDIMFRRFQERLKEKMSADTGGAETHEEDGGAGGY